MQTYFTLGFGFGSVFTFSIDLLNFFFLILISLDSLNVGNFTYMRPSFSISSPKILWGILFKEFDRLSFFVLLFLCQSSKTDSCQNEKGDFALSYFVIHSGCW